MRTKSYTNMVTFYNTLAQINKLLIVTALFTGKAIYREMVTVFETNKHTGVKTLSIFRGDVLLHALSGRYTLKANDETI